jgi:isopenicillin-N epimerase
VTSHGWNDPRAEQGEREPYRLRFDWTGTADPTPSLALADAIGLVGAMEPGGWPALMAANRELVLRARKVVAEALGVATPAPAALIGSMASLPVPFLSTDADAAGAHQALLAQGIQVPVLGWPVPAARQTGAGPQAVLIRLSAQRYNELADYERLAAALTRLSASSGAR